MLHLHALLLHYTHVGKSNPLFCNTIRVFHLFHSTYSNPNVFDTPEEESFPSFVRMTSPSLHLSSAWQKTAHSNNKLNKNKHMLEDETLVLHINLIKRLSMDCMLLFHQIHWTTLSYIAFLRMWTFSSYSRIKYNFSQIKDLEYMHACRA